jgi:hypothetical protein
MAKWTDLLNLLHSGAAPHEIIDRLGVGLWRVRELLNSKRLRARLAMENELAALSVEHQRAAQAVHMVNRLRELANGKKEETARKSCESLLGEAGTGRQVTIPPTGPTSDERIRKLIAQGRLPKHAEATLSWKGEAFKRDLIRRARNAPKGAITPADIANLVMGKEIGQKSSLANVGELGESRGNVGNHGPAWGNAGERGKT